MAWGTLAGLATGALAGPSPAGAGPLEASRPYLRTFGVKEGLPHGTVYQVLEDRQGRLWVSTREGLARYDGRRWHPLPLPADSASQVVRALAETPDGSLWAGTEHDGLWRYHGGVWTAFGAPAPLPDLRVNALWAEVPEGGPWVLWVATSKGAVRHSAEGWTSYGPSEGLASPWVWRFLHYTRPDGSRAFVAATKQGFFEFQGQRWVPFRPLPGLVREEVNDIVQVPQPGGAVHVWVTAWGRGLLRWDGARWDRFDPGNGFPSLFPVDLCPVPDGQGGWTLWAATYDAGLAWFEGERWHLLDAEHGLSARGVYVLAPSRLSRPTLWAGLRDGGLVAVDLGGWRTLDRSSGLPDEEVLCFAQTTAAGAPTIPWVGTGRGVARWASGRWVVDDTRTGLPHNRVQALLAAEGQLWAGTRKGLARWDGRRWAPVPLVPVPSDLQIQCLLASRDPDGEPVLWIGMEEALVRLKRGRCETLPRAPEIPQDNVYALLETLEPEGGRTLWVGTRGNGIYRLRGGRWTRYGAAEGIPNPQVSAFCEHVDRAGRRWLWAGTFGGGLVRRSLDQPEAPWRVFNRGSLPGLPTEVVLSLVAAAPDRLYLGTQSGVVRVAFEDPADPGRPTQAFAYSLGDGLPSLSCSAGALRLDPSGLLWVGTAQGAALLDPRREHPLQPPGPPLLDLARVMGQAEPLHAGAALAHWQNRLLFEFSLPLYHRETDVLFRTQLLGLDPEPLPWTREGRRELSGLGAGSYVLEVLARDHLGRTSPPLRIPFRIRPAPWASPWAYVGYALLLGGGVLGFLHLRTRRLHAHNRDLQQRVAASVAEVEERRRDLETANENLLGLNEKLLHLNERLQQVNLEKDQFMGTAAHDLKNPLNAILLMAQDLGDGEPDPAVVQKYGRAIERLSWQMAQIIKNFLQVNMIDSDHLQMNLQRENLNTLLLDVQADFLERARLKGLTFVLELPEAELSAWVDAAHLRSVLDNFVSNAIKFSPPGPPARRVWLRAMPADGELVLEIQDEGPGFSDADKAKAFQRFVRLSAQPTAGELSTGLGLSIAKKLTEAMGGRLELLSEPGQGALFRILLPRRAPEPAPDTVA